MYRRISGIRTPRRSSMSSMGTLSSGWRQPDNATSATETTPAATANTGRVRIESVTTFERANAIGNNTTGRTRKVFVVSAEIGETPDSRQSATIAMALSEINESAEATAAPTTPYVGINATLSTRFKRPATVLTMRIVRV